MQCRKSVHKRRAKESYSIVSVFIKVKSVLLQSSYWAQSYAPLVAKFSIEVSADLAFIRELCVQYQYLILLSVKSVGGILLKVMLVKWNLLWCFIMCYTSGKRTVDLRNCGGSHQRTDLLLVKKCMGVGLEFKNKKLQSNPQSNTGRVFHFLASHVLISWMRADHLIHTLTSPVQVMSICIQYSISNSLF